MFILLSRTTGKIPLQPGFKTVIAFIIQAFLSKKKVK